ncbi:MAG TPA: type II toxin-antitoxin system RelE/ParE family toxin [Prolixibacteraceae bacterium]|nr:type II toxin-antitoxin system RelE/ParE family toxin [Prolixibacteraceae bacterium]
MSFNVKTISVFESQAKCLMKKFPSLKKEIQTLISELKEEPTKGTSIGHNCYKIRLAIASKGKGKSGGARIITHLVFKDDTVYLLSIYDKSKMENLTDKEIMELIKLIP